MAKLSRSITINAPAEKIFAFMQDPNNLPGIWPGIAKVSDVGQLPNGGACFKYIYKMAGVSLAGYNEDIEVVKNVRAVSKSSGGIDGLVTITYDPVELGTKVTVDTEYIVPVPLLGKLAEAIVVKMSEQDTEKLLENLKTRMEA